MRRFLLDVGPRQPMAHQAFMYACGWCGNNAKQQRESGEEPVTESKNESLFVFILTNTLKLKPMLLLTTNIDLHIANKSIQNSYKVLSLFFPQTAIHTNKSWKKKNQPKTKIKCLVILFFPAVAATWKVVKFQKSFSQQATQLSCDLG